MLILYFQLSWICLLPLTFLVLLHIKSCHLWTEIILRLNVIPIKISTVIFFFFFINREKESEVTQSCPTLCNPMDCSLPGSSVHGIFQSRVLEWVAVFFSRGSSQPSDWTWLSHIVGRHFSVWATREGINRETYL